jgi:hypothetical protein
MTDLGRGVDANLAALFRAMTVLPGSALDERGPVGRHLTFPTNPMFKGAWNTRIGDQAADAAIDETIDWFASRGAPFFFWWTGPDTTPRDLGARLEKRGLLSMEGQQEALAHGIKQGAAGAPVMGADLAAMNEAVLGEAPHSFSIDPVATDADLEAFKQVYSWQPTKYLNGRVRAGWMPRAPLASAGRRGECTLAASTARSSRPTCCSAVEGTPACTPSRPCRRHRARALAPRSA